MLYGFSPGSEIVYSNLNSLITDHNALILGVRLLIKKENKKFIKFRPFNKKLISNFNANFKKDFLISETNKRLINLLKCNNDLEFFSDNFDYDSFLSNYDISHHLIEKMFELFYSLLIKIQNYWFPIIVKEVKNSKNEWFNTEIKALIKIKNTKFGKNTGISILF